MSIEGAVPVFERPVQTSEEALRAFRQVPSPRPQPPTIFESGTPKELVEWLVFGNGSYKVMLSSNPSLSEMALLTRLPCRV
jgi:hypothetical protein